jgi:hypothetical protein
MDNRHMDGPRENGTDGLARELEELVTVPQLLQVLEHSETPHRNQLHGRDP